MFGIALPWFENPLGVATTCGRLFVLIRSLISRPAKVLAAALVVYALCFFVGLMGDFSAGDGGAGPVARVKLPALEQASAAPRESASSSE